MAPYAANQRPQPRAGQVVWNDRRAKLTRDRREVCRKIQWLFPEV
eukprot:CAMPEP_0113680388 /NCGR_PEP_ID=MMETSP0038_2-20120614/11285_1 /TAXON_ID=2898 /ORGANISM="Cryptomonas paramecium" /LENGTH=44 /DNA_ID=CAMNT_0000598751 /DNA_START=1 /DNA_END=135 /DNA_ORIENTATION=- /assembly_acc=CAM_ASM_000170